MCGPIKIGSKKFELKTVLCVKIFAPNHFWGKQNLVQKYIGSKHILGLEIFWVQKKIGGQKVW